MFRIPNFHQVDLTVDEAVEIIKIDNDLLKGMHYIDAKWDEHINEASIFDGDDEFFDNFHLEVNAYNIIWNGMNKLFNGDDVKSLPL